MLEVFLNVCELFSLFVNFPFGSHGLFGFKAINIY